MKGEFYKLDYEAWDEGTVDLTLEQEAAYLRACNNLYRRGGAFPASERLLCAIWRCHANKARALLRALVDAGKLVVSEGVVTSPTMMRMILPWSREVIPHAVRRMVIARDDFRCVYCGDDSGPFEIDHVVPHAKGGISSESNLDCACRTCNRSKGAKHLSDWMTRHAN